TGGTLVSALIAGQVVDTDSGAVSGVAVTGVDDTGGSWQYSMDAGATWATFGSVAPTAALLLAADANTLVRFVPTTEWTGTAPITFQAWDQTSGTAGTTADVTTNGG